MANFKIATWNVNSLRVRLPHVLNWLQQYRPDVLAVQEIKVEDEFFPHEALRDLGYIASVSGQKAYNGVAIISKESQEHVVKDMPGFADSQKRVLAATINGIRVVNLYVPNGESTISPKFQYKLQWLQHLSRFIQAEKSLYPQTIIVGDFNIAPAELDVHDPVLWEGKVHFTEKEREAFQEILSLGFRDCFRQLSPSLKEFSWWDYRLNAFKRNMGLRIDHVLSSDNITVCDRCYIDKDPRAWERPSDHAPVIAEFGL